MEQSRFCAQCGAQRVDQARFCEQCGDPFDPPPALANRSRRLRRRTAHKPEGELTWEIGIPLVTNPRMLGTMAKISVLSTLLIVLLMSVLAVSQGEWDTIPPLLGFFSVLGVGVFGLLLFVMLVVLGNRLRTRYRLDARGVHQETIDRVSRLSNRLAVIAGLLGRSPGTTGAGLLGMSQEQISIAWRGRFTLEARPQRHLLIFRNSWRSLMDVYCTAENFDQVLALARQYMAYHKTAERCPTRSPVARDLLHSALILVAGVPILATHQALDLDILAPLLMLVFALVTRWLIPVFGYPVLLANVWILITLIVAAVEESSYTLLGTQYSYRAYETFSEPEAAMILLSILALAYLSWMAVGAVRGRLMPRLLQDMDDMGL